MVQRLIKESRKEISATLNNNPDQKDQIPEQKPPTKASTEDKPAISDSDLFGTEPDAIHEAWAKLDESERRRNWEKAIAGHKQQRKLEYAPDEMY